MGRATLTRQTVFLGAQIGQIASTRADFLPKQYYNRVKTLQSDVPSEPFDFIRRVSSRSAGGERAGGVEVARAGRPGGAAEQTACWAGPGRAGPCLEGGEDNDETPPWSRRAPLEITLLLARGTRGRDTAVGTAPRERASTRFSKSPRSPGNATPVVTGGLCRNGVSWIQRELPSSRRSRRPFTVPERRC